MSRWFFSLNDPTAICRLATQKSSAVSGKCSAARLTLAIELDCEIDVSPSVHVNIIDLVRQRMPIIATRDTSDAVGKDIGVVRLIPAD